MKFGATALMSLLLLGVCSARTLEMSKSIRMDDEMKSKDDDYSKPSQDERREGAQYDAEDQKSQQVAQLRDTVYQKLRNMNQQLTSFGAGSIPVNDLPEWSDPLEIGSVVDKYTFGTVDHKNVKFSGLAGASKGYLSIDSSSHEATFTLSMNSAVISGYYEASDLIRKASGDFRIKMSDEVTFACTYPYQIQGGKVQLQHSTGKLHYENFDSHYENIGFFAQFLQNALGRDLLRTVSEKVHHELHYKLYTRIQHLIQSVIQNQEDSSAEKAMRDGISSTINGIQQIISKQEGFSIDLTSDDKEMVHNKLRARISSVKLNGIEKFYMVKNHVTGEKSDKLRAKVELALDRPTATAMVTLHEASDEDAPFQKISVDFDMEDLKAELALEKPARQSELELRSVKTSLNRMRPMNADKFEGRVSYLIKERMASHMRRYVEEGLKNFIQKELSSIMSRGVLSPSQE